jgi:NAD+ diphosphatase
VERGESLEEALKREMKEEIGLGIRIVRRVDERVDPYTGDRLVNFLCVTSTPNLELSEELEEAGWFGPDEIEEIEDIHPGLKRFLLDGLREGTFF